VRQFEKGNRDSWQFANSWSSGSAYEHGHVPSRGLWTDIAALRRRTVFTFLLVAAAMVLALLVVAWCLLRIAGSRSAWVVLGGNTSDSIIVVRDPALFRTILRCPPSEAWASYWQFSGAVAVDPGAAVPAPCAVWQTGQTTPLPNGTRAEVVGRLLLSERDLKAKCSGMMSSNQGDRRVEVVKIRVRSGPHAGLEGWTIPWLMQHEIVWP
jgi:hypothetical protein